MASVAELDVITERMYANPDPTARQQAKEHLTSLIAEGSDSAALKAILEQSSSQYSLLFVSQGVVSWFRANRKNLTMEEQRELIVERCGGCLKRVFTAGAPRHVITSVMTAYTRLTKLTFNKEPFLLSAVNFPLELLNTNNVTDYVLALLLLDNMVNEFSRYDSSKADTLMNFAYHRRCSNNFRDECLLNVFTTSLSALAEVSAGNAYVTEVVELVKDCLTYDFMAIMVDETEDALSTQYPASWKDLLFADSTQRVLWGQLAALPYPLNATLLTGLAGMCGVRRTFFDSSEERVQYLDCLLGMLVDAAAVNDGRMKNPHFVTVFAEACLRFVAPFGYRDLHCSQLFERWVDVVRMLSGEVFAIPFGHDGSFTAATTLLSFWSRLTTSRRMYMSDGSARDLEYVTPQLLSCFFQSRVCSSGGGDYDPRAGDPLSTHNSSRAATPSGGLTPSGPPGGAMNSFSLDEDGDSGTLEVMLTQSEAFATIALMDLRPTVESLAEYLNQVLGPRVLNCPSATAWLFFCAGSLARQGLANVEEDAVDACSSFFVYCVDCANHRRMLVGRTPTGPGSLFGNLVERAVLHFLKNVELALAGGLQHPLLEMIVTNIFRTRAQLFQFILSNTGQNIMRTVESNQDEDTAEIIRSSIELIGDACRNVPKDIVSELSFDLPPVHELPLAQSVLTYKLRTNLYSVLWLLRRATPYTPEVLISFIQPIINCMQYTLSGEGSSPSYIAGWFRDLRGVARAVSSNGEVLGDFIMWFCEQAGVLQSILAGPAGESSMVIIALLRFMTDLVYNHCGRFNFPTKAHSASGLMLFKHLCTLIQQITERCITDEHIRILASGGSVDGVYEGMLKPLGLCMTCLGRCVRDGFVPFGAMWYYKDDTYDNTLLGLLRMLAVFPAPYFKMYPKVALAVADLLSTVTDEQVYEPLTRMTSAELEATISFVVCLCEDDNLKTNTLLHALSFLSFVAGLIKEVKQLMVAPALGPNMPEAASDSYPASGMANAPYYPLSSMSNQVVGMLKSGRYGLRYQHSTRLQREALARLLEPCTNLWPRLVAVAMNIIVCQDRALSVCCAIVYPIFEIHPPFWSAFVESFVQSYPERKRALVRDILSALSTAADTQDHFFSEVFAFRQQLRAL